MRFGIDKEILEAMIRCLKEEPSINNAIIFGSRARGRQRYNSDIDIAISCQGDIPADLILKIEEAAGIYQVDVIDIKKVGEDLRKSIGLDGVSIYEKL